MEYLHLFNTDAEFQDAYTNNYHEPWISYTKETDTIKYNKTEEEKYRELLATPLTFEILSDGDIVWKTNNSSYTCTIEYKKNDGEWTEITSSIGTSAPSINVASGDVVQFRGDNTTYGTSGSLFNTFNGTICQFNIKGNIMSLIDSTGYTTATTLSSTYTFIGLFYGCTGLTSAENLILPATTLAYGCYSFMFQGCTALTSAPELSATTLEASCYRSMFENCVSLVNAPSKLPATILTDRCYMIMFKGCTSLTTAPEILATTTEVGCFNGTFRNCTALTKAPKVLSATTMTLNCYNSMFRDCASLTTAPELPATTLADGCYKNMFNGCTNLTYIKCLATDISATDCTTDWVNSVAASGTFTKAASMSSWATGANGIPANWTIQNA